MAFKVITLDGASATGKGTVAALLAKKLGWLCFDTGAMYRSFACHVENLKLDCLKAEQREQALKTFDFSIQHKGEKKSYYIGKEEVTDRIRSLSIASLASELSQILEVRQHLVEIQKKIAQGQAAVFEGRDMGSVVFPKASLKIFLVAEDRIRAERRLKDLPGADFEKVYKELKKRDAKDLNRLHSPLVKGKGAIEIDTSYVSPEEVVEQILKLWKELA